MDLVVTFFVCLSSCRNFFLAGLLGGFTGQLFTKGSMHGNSCGEFAVRFSVNELFALAESSIAKVLLATDNYVKLRMSEQMRV